MEPWSRVLDVHVEATVTGEQACVTVRHAGRAVGERGIDRGRGLMLVEALLESRAASIGSLREYCATRLDAAVA